MLNWHYYIWVLVNYETGGKLANVSLKTETFIKFPTIQRQILSDFNALTPSLLTLISPRGQRVVCLCQVLSVSGFASPSG